MDLFLAAVEKGGPWAVCVVLLYIIWDMQKRNEKGIRESIRDQIAALQTVVSTLSGITQALSVLSACLQTHDRRSESIEETVKFNARALDEIKSITTKVDEALVRVDVIAEKMKERLDDLSKGGRVHA